MERIQPYLKLFPIAKSPSKTVFHSIMSVFKKVSFTYEGVAGQGTMMTSVNFNKSVLFQYNCCALFGYRFSKTVMFYLLISLTSSFG